MSTNGASFGTVSVLGLGKVGLLAATFLDEAGVAVVGIDQHPAREETDFPTRVCDISDLTTLKAQLADTEAVLSCLPFHLNRPIAELAHTLGIHYFDLTEDVGTTQSIVELSKTSKGLMAPQCGLAPGFVAIVGASLIESFDECRSVRMRVGALPQYPTGLLGYSFNWSPEGVVNEYLNDCEVVEEGVRKWVSSMEWRETLVIGGTQLEAFTTSGGLGTMCDTYAGRVANIDYKTIRYPGHVDLMNFFFHELLMRERRDLAAEILTNAKPPVDDDVVYVHVAAEGMVHGQLRRKEFVRSYRPKVVGGMQSTAIAWTTAGSVAAVIEMVRKGSLPRSGLLRQEDIPFDAFVATATGRLFAE